MLVARVLDGDATAFRTLVDRYHVPCSRFALRMLGHREDAEDAIQEAFISAYRGLGRYDERNRFRAWLYRILVNECRTLARGRTRRDRWLVADSDSAAHVPGRSEERDSEARDALQQALDGIEPPLREAFLLHHGEGLDYVEMSLMTGASVPALKMRVKRARDAMRSRLEGFGDD